MPTLSDNATRSSLGAASSRSPAMPATAAPVNGSSGPSHSVRCRRTRARSAAPLGESAWSEWTANSHSTGALSSLDITAPSACSSIRSVHCASSTATSTGLRRRWFASCASNRAASTPTRSSSCLPPRWLTSVTARGRPGCSAAPLTTAKPRRAAAVISSSSNRVLPVPAPDSTTTTWARCCSAVSRISCSTRPTWAVRPCTAQWAPVVSGAAVSVSSSRIRRSTLFLPAARITSGAVSANRG
ncbi:hypothetical protein BBK82_44190 [Lentzea guizhouensis]|uniref:Uncharacterized protein n=1 Tax=Lentzea guizhouensis TaxID=1586287 RepID=A0A1B2HW45_9PSEU|nr:hypothetical protein BBK82_44190 [Lentzea guizhouensis]